METRSILIVDDNADNMLLTQLLLEPEGYIIRSAENAQQALACLQSFTPDMILMDIQMPEMDGLELTRLLRRNPALRSTKILALTAYAMKGDEESTRAAGCDGYISKPIDVMAFPAIVHSFFDARLPAPC